MVLYPEVMRKAQAELDAIVGRERLPNFEDEDKLPYIRAISKEVLRWRPVGPLCELCTILSYDCDVEKSYSHSTAGHRGSSYMIGKIDIRLTSFALG